jgi:hypothetical protein
MLSTPYSNSLTTNFDKLLSTYSLGTRFFFKKELEKISFMIHENYYSTFLKGVDKSIRDEQYLSLSSSYKLSNDFSPGLFGNNHILSDDREIEINQASVSNAGLFILMKPMDELKLNPFGGFSNNRQVGEVDNGPIYGVEGLLENFFISDFSLTSSLKFRNEDILPRRNLIRAYKLKVYNGFEQNVYNNIDFNYSLNRKDFYYDADSLISQQYNVTNNIQARAETYFLLQDRLQYFNTDNSFSAELLGRVSRRIIDRETAYKPEEVFSSSVYDTKIYENRIDFEGVAFYRTSIFSGTLKAVLSERDEKHQAKNYTGTGSVFYDERVETEAQKNNISSRASLSFLGNFRLSSSDRFYFSLLQNKLRYDTPSEMNFDDRDELLTIIRLRYSKELSPFFTAFLNTDASQAKTVYIFAEKSSNNNVNRVLRFAAGGDYRGKNFSSLNIFEVTANYTVYDYEDLNPNYQSYSFRQFTGTDSTYIRLSKRFGASVYGYLKLSEQGDLKWASFSTKPTRFLQEIYGEPKLHLLYSEITFSIGIRFFSLNTYNFDKKTKVLESRYATTGPLAEILYLVTDRIYLKFYGWYEFINTGGSITKEQANLNLQMIWNI